MVHPWARSVIETRTNTTPAVLEYMDTLAGLFLAGGLTPDHTHHVMHALGSRMWGFTQEVFDGSEGREPTVITPDAQIAMIQHMAESHPHLLKIALAAAHDDASVVGHGCDDQFEFEFALDLLLDGVERLHERSWRSGG
jgi:hypothetical protein